MNKELGPEMKSTGESIYFIDDLQDPFFKKVYSERNLFLLNNLKKVNINEKSSHCGLFLFRICKFDN